MAARYTLMSPASGHRSASTVPDCAAVTSSCRVSGRYVAPLRECGCGRSGTLPGSTWTLSRQLTVTCASVPVIFAVSVMFPGPLVLRLPGARGRAARRVPAAAYGAERGDRLLVAAWHVLFLPFVVRPAP